MPRSATLEAVLNTIEHERHARGALVQAFADELDAAVSERAPDSTRRLLARARIGSLADAEIPTLLDEVRATLRLVAA